MQVGGGLTLVDWEVGRKGWGVILKRGEGEWAEKEMGLGKLDWWAWIVLWVKEITRVRLVLVTF